MQKYCYISDKNPLYAKHQNNELHKLQVLLFKEIVGCMIVFALFVVQHNYSIASNPVITNLTPQTSINNSQVLGAQTKNAEPTSNISPTLQPTVIPTVFPETKTQIDIPTISPTPSSKPYAKHNYNIAVYGDSMVDTMGERLEYLEHSLKRIYPRVNFTLYNYGKGSENVEMGLNRWNSKLDYQDRHYPSIVELKPDIIIMGSFGYNPFTPFNRDQHWLGLTKLIEAAKTITPNVYIMAEIAPLRNNFGKGPNGVNWDEPTAYEHSGKIIQQLENAIGLSRTLNVPLINVFEKSKGNPSLTNPSDGIHPSVTGHEFTADIIVDTISLN